MASETVLTRELVNKESVLTGTSVSFVGRIPFGKTTFLLDIESSAEKLKQKLFKRLIVL